MHRADIMTTRIRAVREVIIIIVATMRHIFIQMESARIRMGRFRMKIRPVVRRLASQSAGNQNQVTEQMNTYQPVFDANYYYMNNP